MPPNQPSRFERRTDAPGKNLTRPEPTIQTLQWRLLAQAPAGFIDTDWSDWMTPAVLAHMSANGRWMDVGIAVRHEPGEPLRCHFTVLDRWCSRPASQAHFGFGLYPYRQCRWWWLPSWLIDSTGTLIDSAERDERTQYFGVRWDQELLDAVNATPGHEFEDILADGLRSHLKQSHRERGRKILLISRWDSIPALK